MAWRKSPPALIALFEAAVPGDPAVSRRKMFGYPAAFVNGNLFMGLHQETFIVRLSEVDRAEFTGQFGERTFEPMPGRRMREYVELPQSVLDDSKSRAAWIARGLAYARKLEARGDAARKPKSTRQRKT